MRLAFVGFGDFDWDSSDWVGLRNGLYQFALAGVLVLWLSCMCALWIDVGWDLVFVTCGLSVCVISYSV